MRGLLPGCAIYFGLLQPRGTSIKYVAASKDSVIVGKRLRRGRGLSFQCIDEKVMLKVESLESKEAKDLVFFCPKINAGWPWLAVPLRHGAKDGVVRGVLAVDSFELVPKGRDDEDQPEKGVPEFLERVGALIGTTLDLKSKQTSLEDFARTLRSGGGRGKKKTHG
jgi:hypothetical protein